MCESKCNKNCFLILLSIFILFSTVIIFSIGIMVKGNVYHKNKNISDSENLCKDDYYIDCTCYSDVLNQEVNEDKKILFKAVLNKCRRLKIFNILEHLIIIINFGSSILFLIIESIRKYKSYSLLFIFPPIISIVSTTIYIIYNGYIFINDYPILPTCRDLIFISTKYINNKSLSDFDNSLYLNKNFIKTNEEGAFAKLDFSSDKYFLLYPKKNDYDIFGPYITYKDLGNKMLNYNKKLYFKNLYGNKFDNNYNDNEDFLNCQSNDIKRVYNGLFYQKTYLDSNGDTNTCEYLYNYYTESFDYTNKDIFIRWVTTLILGGLIIFIHFIIMIIGFIKCCN